MSDADDARRAWRIVLAATVFNLPIGSLYAFSVLLRPLEVLLGVGRADLALVFALAAAGFGVGTNLAPAAYRLAPAPALVLGDRKSTRLNSSHLGISYAVFCL